MLLSVWPPPRSLATTKGISVDVFSSPYLDVSVQAVPLIHLWIQCMMHDLHRADFSIRKSAGQSSLTAHRSLSQLTTSFIGSQCQGIHPALYFALPFALFSTLIFPQSFGTLRSCELCLNNVFLQTSLKFVGYSCFYPTSFDFTRLMSLKRIFLIIFALHLLFSFQGTLSVPFRTDFRRKFPFSSNPL